jgi:hypothetical protein
MNNVTRRSMMWFLAATVAVCAGLVFQINHAIAQGDDPFSPRRSEKAADPFGPPAPQKAETDSDRAGPGGSNRRAAVLAGGQARNGERREAVRPDGRKRAPSFAAYAVSPAEQRIREELDKPTDLEFNEVPLKDVVEYIKDKHGIELQLDERLLADAAVATDTPITLNLKGVSLRSAMRLMLGRLPGNPTFVVADEVLLITTREGAAERKVVRVYNVGDLVEARRNPQGDPFGVPGATGGYGVPAASDSLSELANVIQQAIEPGTWTPERGCAVVPLVSKDTPLLVVRHSRSAHDEIVELLKSIHDTQQGHAKAEQ